MSRKNLPQKGSRNSVAVSDVNDLVLQDTMSSTDNFEGIGADDLALPFIKLLQSGSPQCKRGGGEYVEGAAEGLFYNTVTGEVLGEEILLVPCAYEKAYVEWRLRENGGGFVAKHSDQSILSVCHQDEKNRNVLKNGNHIVTTAYHYCLYVREDGDYEAAVISLTSTQLKKSRKWNSQQKALKIRTKKGLITPPRFSHVYTASSILDQNELGSWYLWDFHSPVMIQERDLYQSARSLHNDFLQGTIKVSVPQDDQGGETEYHDDNDTF